MGALAMTLPAAPKAIRPAALPARAHCQAKPNTSSCVPHHFGWRYSDFRPQAVTLSGSARVARPNHFSISSRGWPSPMQTISMRVGACGRSGVAS
jgi:hypothetical protein